MILFQLVEKLKAELWYEFPAVMMIFVYSVLLAYAILMAHLRSKQVRQLQDKYQELFLRKCGSCQQLTTNCILQFHQQQGKACQDINNMRSKRG
jgi:hypothetical protein